MKDLIIVGAGGLGRKVFVCLRRLNVNNKWNIKGFIDDNEHALDGKKCDLPIIGKISTWQPKCNEVFVMGISEPATKYKVSKIMLDKGARFETVVSSDVILGDYVEIGEGSVVMTPYNIESGAYIGKFVTVLGSTLALDGVIGDYSTTAGFANLTDAHIGKGVYVGSQTFLNQGISVGNCSYVGVGSICLKDIAAGTQVFGTPARVIGEKEIFINE